MSNINNDEKTVKLAGVKAELEEMFKVFLGNPGPHNWTKLKNRMYRYQQLNQMQSNPTNLWDEKDEVKE